MTSVENLLKLANSADSNEQIEQLISELEQLQEDEFKRFFQLWDEEGEKIQKNASLLIQKFKDKS